MTLAHQQKTSAERIVARFETDICVIGSGVAGAIVAQECVDAGRDVLMLEAGGRVSRRTPVLGLVERVARSYERPRMNLWYRKAKYRRTDHRSIGNRAYGCSALLARGGSTLGWAGAAFRLKPEDFRLASLTGQGLDWPLGYDELERYYTLAEKTLRVAGDGSDAGHPPRTAPFPIAAQPFHARDNSFLDLLADRAWPSMHHNVSVAPDGSPFTADRLLDELEKRNNFRLLLNSVATRIDCSSHERATAVEFLNSTGESFAVHAEKIIVCTGGIEVPNLLRHSANQWWPDGLGNHADHLGRHLVSHTGVAIGGRPRGFRNGPILTTAVTRHFDSTEEQASGKYILLWKPTPKRCLSVNAVFEQFPDRNNTVTSASARTRFGTPAPVINFNHAEQHRERGAALARHLETLAEPLKLDITSQRTYVLAHPMCTARMSLDPADGVVDPNLRIHMMDNVYVCGSANFVSGGAANPTLTIAALSHRLGDTLARHG